MFPDPIFNVDIPFIKDIHWYGVMIAVGVLFCFLTLFYFGKKLGLSTKFVDFVFYNGIVSIALGFFSAAVFQAFYNYLDNPEGGFKLGSGITFIGGLIGGAACFLIIYFIFKKKLDGKLTDILSLVPCCITVAHAFGRLGCLFAGCCHGAYLGEQPVTGGIWMEGTHPEYGYKMWGYFVPTQLYEAIFLFVLFALFVFLLLKFGFRRNLELYLILYGIFRFVIEYFRADDRGQLVGKISPSQFWSILMVVLGAGLWVVMTVWEKKRATTAPTEEISGETEE